MRQISSGQSTQKGVCNIIHAACLSLTPLAPHFVKIKISLDEISFFSFSYHFVAVIDLLLGLLPVQKFLRIKAILQDRQFVPWRAKLVAGNFGLAFSSNFWAFPCISQAPLNRSFWSLYHWKDLFLLETLNRDDTRNGTKANTHHGWSSAQESMG